MTDPRAWLAEVQERASRATEGPWVAEYSGEQGTCVIPHDARSAREAVAITRLYHQQADAEFIAHARTEHPAMAAALTSVLDALDNYPVPSRQTDPTGQILEALEGLERSIRTSITDALGGDRG